MLTCIGEVLNILESLDLYVTDKINNNQCNEYDKMTFISNYGIIKHILRKERG